MTTRMSADDRRELVLEAATRAFAKAGYHGTSTDVVARGAGVSQPYVVRMFGSKLELFLAVMGRACERIRSGFQGVLDEGPFDPDDEAHWERLGIAYADLLRDRHVLQVLMHGFSAGAVDEIAEAGRRGMADIFRTVLGTGCTPDQARDFVAHGMLLNVMLSLRAPEHRGESEDLDVLTVCAFGDALAVLD